MKGFQIEFFPLCIAFRKVIFFIYQKIYLSDRVPLSIKESLVNNESYRPVVRPLLVRQMNDEVASYLYILKQIADTCYMLHQTIDGLVLQ